MYGKHSTDFITQKCPYVLGSDTSQAGAGELASDLFLNILLIQLYLVLPNVEANFDLPVETTSQTSSSGHSPLPSPLIRSGQERDGGDNALVWEQQKKKTDQNLQNVGSSLGLYHYLNMYMQVEIPSAPVPHSPPAILLNPKPSITAGDFEKKWIAMPKM